MKVAMIGKGNVGTAIGKGLNAHGHEVKYGHRDPNEPVKEAAEWGELIVLAVPYEAIDDVVREMGLAVDGKVVLDVTNAIGEHGKLAIGFSTSAAEELQKKLPKSYVAKAFNTVFAPNQSSGKIGQWQLTLFVASDNERAKEMIMQLGAEMGFDAVDAGSLRAARYLEPMAMLLISLGYDLGMGTDIGYKLAKKGNQ
jgi:predicted dinucleotide-binding enzyme